MSRDTSWDTAECQAPPQWRRLSHCESLDYRSTRLRKSSVTRDISGPLRCRTQRLPMAASCKRVDIRDHVFSHQTRRGAVEIDRVLYRELRRRIAPASGAAASGPPAEQVRAAEAMDKGPAHRNSWPELCRSRTQHRPLS